MCPYIPCMPSQNRPNPKLKALLGFCISSGQGDFICKPRDLVISVSPRFCGLQDCLGRVLGFEGLRAKSSRLRMQEFGLLGLVTSFQDACWTINLSNSSVACLLHSSDIYPKERVGDA